MRITQTVFKIIDLQKGPSKSKERTEQKCDAKNQILNTTSDKIKSFPNISEEEDKEDNFNRICQTELPNNSSKMKIKKSTIKTICLKGNAEYQICILCCQNNADGVILPCCHGGICFDCGKIIAQQNAVCHFCRKVF